MRSSAATSIGSLGYQPALAGLLKAASDNAEVGDAIVSTGEAMGLAGSQSEAKLIDAAKGADQAARVAIVLALAKSPRVGEFMADNSETVALEAARAIWDTPIVAANGALAASLK